MRSLKQMLKERELVVGLMVRHICAPRIAKLYANAGAGNTNYEPVDYEGVDRRGK